MLACYVLALKLLYGLTDGQLHPEIFRNINWNDAEGDERPAWRFKDLSAVRDIRAQISKADKSIWPRDQNEGLGSQTNNTAEGP